MDDTLPEIGAKTPGEGPLGRSARGSRHARSAAPSITARLSLDEKARFKALARHFGLSESTLALRAIRILLDRDEEWVRPRPQIDFEHTAASDRLTIRLRPGDGLEVIRRAVERGVKPATYVSALVRAHITANPPLPTAEMAALKSSIAVLAGLGTLLGHTSRHGIPSGSQGEVYREAIRRTRVEIATLEQRIVDLTRAALIAWETHS